jgi:hypothetical protein
MQRSPSATLTESVRKADRLLEIQFRTEAPRALATVENLAEWLAEGIVFGHPDMPIFEFSPQEVEAILAYAA